MADEIINEEVLISTETLSHFKVKQDLENETKFKKKDDATDLKGAVRYDAAQVLTEEQKAQARANIGAGTSDITESGEGAVRYDVQQALDEENKARARANIGTTDGTWENMPDKPFGVSGYSIEWDGVTTEGLPFVEVADGMGFYKGSDIIPTKEELIGANCVGADGEGKPTSFIITAEDIGDYNEYCYGKIPTPCFLIATQETDVSILGMTLHFTAGTWFISYGIPMSITVGGIKKIDKKFLPDDIGVPDNVVTTDENGLIPTSMLPSYVDDVIEGYYNTEDSLFYEEAEFTTAITGETGKIYTDLASKDIYRWSGSVFVQINPKTYRLATNDDIDALFGK